MSSNNDMKWIHNLENIQKCTAGITLAYLPQMV